MSKFADATSLSVMDGAWKAARDQSLIVKCGRAIKNTLSNIDGEPVRKFGSLLQTVSFAIAMVLFAILPLPRFTEDKMILGLISFAGFSAWLLGYMLGGKETRRSSAVDIPVLCFLGMNVVATCASHYLKPAVHGLALVFLYISSYFYLSAVFTNAPKRKLTIVLILMAAAFACSLHGFWQFKTGVEPLATWEDPTVETQGTRIFSTLGNPNLLAGYLIPIAPLAFAVCFSAVTARKMWLAMPLFGVASAITVAIILTGSRGGYLAVGASGAVIFLMAVAQIWLAKPKLRLLIVLGCVVLPILILLGLHFVPSFEQRLTSIFAGREHSSNSFRINVWHASWKMFKDNWWFGIGPGNQVFVLAYGLYMVSGFDALGTYCVPLEVVVETGILGGIAFATLIMCLFARGHISFWAQRGANKDGNSSPANPDYVSTLPSVEFPLIPKQSAPLSMEQWLTAGAVAALVGLLAQGMVDTIFYRPQVQFIFWLVAAIIVTDPNSIKRNS